MIEKDIALSMVKYRLNRLQDDTRMDNYFQMLIDAAVGELEATGIHLTSSAADLMLVVDKAVLDYQNRDKPGGDPEWFRLKRRERWLQERGEQDDP